MGCFDKTFRRTSTPPQRRQTPRWEPRLSPAGTQRQNTESSSKSKEKTPTIRSSPGATTTTPAHLGASTGPRHPISTQRHPYGALQIREPTSPRRHRPTTSVGTPEDPKGKKPIDPLSPLPASATRPGSMTPAGSSRHLYFHENPPSRTSQLIGLPRPQGLEVSQSFNEISREVAEYAQARSDLQSLGSSRKAFPDHSKDTSKSLLRTICRIYKTAPDLPDHLHTDRPIPQESLVSRYAKQLYSDPDELAAKKMMKWGLALIGFCEKSAADNMPIDFANFNESNVGDYIEAARTGLKKSQKHHQAEKLYD